MRAGIVSLIFGYVLSQFYRAFLAVLTPALGADLGATAQDLASASGWWFLTFALAQIPVGAALDRFGPRRTAAAFLTIAALGAGTFAMAQEIATLKLAMALIGIGCAPVLMASYFIFARSFSPAAFGTLAGAMVGIGSFGNLAASLPLSAAVEMLGWRPTMWGLSAATMLAAIGIAALVKDPKSLETGPKGSLLDLLKMPQLWPILIMMAACHAAPAGLRGLWTGPYLADVFGADASLIGTSTLLMGLGMVAGNFAYGPMEKVIGSRKRLVLLGNGLMAACLVGLAMNVNTKGWTPTVLLTGIGFFGASFPIVMAHGRAFLPPHLVGRGVTLINLFGIGSVGLMQMVTGRLHSALTPSLSVVNSAPPSTPYFAIFSFYAALTVAGMVVYLLANDRTD